MFKFALYAAVTVALWLTGTWAYAALAYIGWEFFKGARYGGGVSGGLKAIAVKSIFAGMVYFAAMSPLLTGSTALLVGSAGVLGLMWRLPTFKPAKPAKSDHADDPAACAGDAGAGQGNANSQTQPKKGGGKNKKQGVVSWLLMGSNGSSMPGKQGMTSWLVKGPDPRVKQEGGVLAWLLYGKPMKKKPKNPAA